MLYCFLREVRLELGAKKLLNVTRSPGENGCVRDPFLERDCEILDGSLGPPAEIKSLISSNILSTIFACS